MSEEFQSHAEGNLSDSVRERHYEAEAVSAPADCMREVQQDEYLPGRVVVDHGRTDLPPPRVSPFSDPSNKREVSPRHFFMILNPFSGNKRGRGMWKRVKPMFDDAGVRVTLTESCKFGHPEELARTTDFSLYDGLLLMGGDGTLHEVVNGLFAREDMQDKQSFDLPIGLFPGGTGNNVVTEVLCGGAQRGGADGVIAAKAILEGCARGFDIGKCTYGKNGEHGAYFANMFGWALASESNGTAEQLRSFRSLRYDVAGVWNMLMYRRHQCRITLDGHVIHGDLDFVSIQNNQCCGVSMRVAPYAKIDDGLFELAFARSSGRVYVMRLFDQMQRRNGSHVFMDGVEMYRCREFTLQCLSPGREEFCLDGVNLRECPVTLRCLPRALCLLAPSSYPEDDGLSELSSDACVHDS